MKIEFLSCYIIVGVPFFKKKKSSKFGKLSLNILVGKTRIFLQL